MNHNQGGEQLSIFQETGVNDFQLTTEQVRTSNFGSHTLYAIEALISDNRVATNLEAFHQVVGLDVHQASGVGTYQLTREQVEIVNFGAHTINAIHRLTMPNRGATNQEAYTMVAGLDVNQVRGIMVYGLTRAQVEISNFGSHTIDAINTLSRQHRASTNLEAFNRVAGLSRFQVVGLVNFRLTNEQVNAPNFSRETITAIMFLTNESRGAITIREAFDRVVGLNRNQIRGILTYHLTREQVQIPNFGAHTLKAIDILMSHHIDPTILEAFHRVMGLDQNQIRGILFNQLTREQVEIPNFGSHTITAINDLMLTDRVQTSQEAYALVEGLDEAQALGVVSFELNRAQVLNPSYNEAILDTMVALDAAIPQREGEYLYETAIAMSLSQIRGISEYELTLEQVGVGVSGFDFVEQEPLDFNFSENTVNALEVIRTQNPEFTPQQRYSIAMNLNSLQVRGLIDFGLSLEQVNTQEFRDTEQTILQELAENVSNKIEEFNLPLSEEGQKLAKEELDNLLAIHKEQDIQETQAAIDQSLAIYGTASRPSAVENDAIDNKMSATFHQPQNISRYTQSMGRSESYEKKLRAKKDKIKGERLGK